MINNILQYFIFYVIYFLNNIIRKSDEIFLFSSSPDYTDNSYCCFEYMLKVRKKSDRFIWILNDNLNVVKKEGVVYCKKYSFKGIYYFFRAKYIFHTHGLYFNATSSKQKIFSLWHGMPLKKIQYLFHKDIQSIACQNLDFEFTIATSSLMAVKMSQCFNCSTDKIKITGLPRNDLFFDNCKFNMVNDYEKVIVWMPTYRQTIRRCEGEQYIFGVPLLDSENINELNDFCMSHGVKLLVKLHPLQKFVKVFPKLENIILLNTTNINTTKHFYSYLGTADALLTDYSSVYVDYLTVDKPIGFILDDFDKYHDERGFTFKNPLEYMPGKHIYNLKELKCFIYEIANGVDTTKYMRDTIGIKLNRFRDNKNTERVMKQVLFIARDEKYIG